MKICLKGEGVEILKKGTNSVKSEGDKIAVVCVLKSGGDFTSGDVVNLKIMLDKNISIPYDFYCLTDLWEIDRFRIIPLEYEFSGWWSKMELFRPDLVDADRIVFFDLDTIIINNIDDLLLQDDNFIGLRLFRHAPEKENKYAGSGILSWKNDGSFDFLFRQFRYEIHSRKFRGDQDYISWHLCRIASKFKYWQDLVSGIYSYKRHVRVQGMPEDARVICFHGTPRPWEVDALWIKEALA
jgi:hypothetical protein